MSEFCRYCFDNQEPEMCDNCAQSLWHESKMLLLRTHRTLHEVLGYYVSTNAQEHKDICDLMEDIRELIGEKAIRAYESQSPDPRSQPQTPDKATAKDPAKYASPQSIQESRPNHTIGSVIFKK